MARKSNLHPAENDVHRKMYVTLQKSSWYMLLSTVMRQTGLCSLSEREQTKLRIIGMLLPINR